MEMEEAKMEIFTNDVRHYPRSNARSQYRKPEGRPGTARSNYARKNSANKKVPPSTFKERTIFQATICGGFLAVLLFFNIIDTSFTNAVTGWIDHNISYDMLAEEGGIGGWVDSVLGIFGNGGENDIQPTYEVLYDGAGAGFAAPVMSEQLPPAAANTVDSSRVDENILREIETAVDLYYDGYR